jgi:hypothetical protein
MGIESPITKAIGFEVVSRELLLRALIDVVFNRVYADSTVSSFHLIQTRVGSSFAQKHPMRPDLHDMSTFQHNNLIGILDRA